MRTKAKCPGRVKTTKKLAVLAFAAITALSFTLVPMQAKTKVRKPGKPVIRSASVSSFNSVTVKWKGAKNATSYQIRYAKTKKTGKKWVKTGSWKTINVGKKARSKKIKKLSYSSRYIVQVRAKRVYKEKIEKKTIVKTKTKYGNYSSRKSFNTGRKNTVIQLVVKDKWNKTKGATLEKRLANYNKKYKNYVPTVKAGKSIQYYLKMKKGKYGQKVKKVSCGEMIALKKVKDGLYRATVDKDSPECTQTITAKTATSVAETELYVPEQWVVKETNNGAYWDDKDKTAYESIALDEIGFGSKKFHEKVKAQIQKIIDSNAHSTNVEKMLVLQKVSNLVATYDYGNGTNETIDCKQGSAYLIEAAKLMGISDSKIWVQDGDPPGAYKQKLQNYRKATFEVHCGVCIQFGIYKYRIDAQGGGYKCQVQWFNDNVKPATACYPYIQKDGTVEHSYGVHEDPYINANGLSYEVIAFSKADYEYEHALHPLYDFDGYWSSDGKTFVKVK